MLITHRICPVCQEWSDKEANYITIQVQLTSGLTHRASEAKNEDVCSVECATRMLLRWAPTVQGKVPVR